MSMINCKHCKMRIDVDYDSEHEDECQTADEDCEYCGGEGVMIMDAPVYPGEPHMAPIETQPCICLDN